MADVNILEFLVYALICYTGMVGLIVSAFRNPPAGRSGSVVRAIWLLPSIFLGGFDIYFDNTVTTNTIINLNTTEVFTESFNSTAKYTLLNTSWVPLHLLFGTVMTVYVLMNIIYLFVKRD